MVGFVVGPSAFCQRFTSSSKPIPIVEDDALRNSASFSRAAFLVGTVGQRSAARARQEWDGCIAQFHVTTHIFASGLHTFQNLASHCVGCRHGYLTETVIGFLVAGYMMQPAPSERDYAVPMLQRAQSKNFQLRSFVLLTRRSKSGYKACPILSGGLGLL